jgi:3-isopropylmalate dehydrogenase
VYHRDEIERIAHLAFGIAKGRKNKLTLVDKANVLATSRLWRETVTAMAPSYPEVEFETLFVDNAAMKLIQQPTAFDVILTSNLFGDILSDEASVITGSLGTLASASEGLKTSLFEPVHGSYPQAAGQNRANPMAMILSAAMMLDKLGLANEAEGIREAVTSAIASGIVTEDLNHGKSSTSEVGDFIAQHI